MKKGSVSIDVPKGTANKYKDRLKKLFLTKKANVVEIKVSEEEDNITYIIEDSLENLFKLARSLKLQTFRAVILGLKNNKIAKKLIKSQADDEATYIEVMDILEKNTMIEFKFL